MPKSFKEGPRQGNDADAIAEVTDGVLERLCYLLGFNGTSFDRLRSGGNNADAQAAIALGVLKNLSHLMGFNGTTWDRLLSGATNADDQTSETGGVLKVLTHNFVYGGGNWDRLKGYDNAGDGDSTDSKGLAGVKNFPALFNGAQYDRQRNNQEFGLLSSSARAATTASGLQTNYNSSRVHVIVDVTSITDTPSVEPVIQGYDSLSGKYYEILRGTAITSVTGTGTYVFKVGPGLTPSAGAVAADFLPRSWRVNMEHADADSITYSVAANVVL